MAHNFTFMLRYNDIMHAGILTDDLGLCKDILGYKIFCGLLGLTSNLILNALPFLMQLMKPSLHI